MILSHESIKKEPFLYLTLLLLLVSCFSRASKTSDAEDTTLCGDVLESYAKKPEGLEFLSCETVENSQTLVRATYRVAGKEAQKIEAFLVANYGMGTLQWTCCGWENGGSVGHFQHDKLKEMDTYLSGTITMWASGEIPDTESPTGVRLELDRNKIANFTVMVSLIKV